MYLRQRGPAHFVGQCALADNFLEAVPQALVGSKGGAIILPVLSPYRRLLASVGIILL